MILSSCLLILSSCGTVKIQDERFCANKGELGARCVWDLSGRVEKYSEDEWKDMSFGWIAAHPDTFARRQAALLKFCKDTGRCKQEEVQDIERAGKRIKTLSRP